ncbi:MAG: lipocalin family protein [Salinivirgaceae bacterium]|nr:lipocalin family protein [Salinivirgaceae bacterium]MDD4747721.1 lipocalin family protein [Salinivirgaceae bacterium]MDY0279511.1 lipocalin family protein [Salinivirgaceae bacterium]
MQSTIRLLKLFILVIIFYSCSPMKQEYRTITVKQFDIAKYQGVWYEIARFPSTFEKGLNNVTAEYQVREDGKLTVINKGYKGTPPSLSKIKGSAQIPDVSAPGAIKVQFFWPFTSWYLVADIEPQNYDWALVTTPNRKYNWILSRKPAMDSETLNSILEKAHKIGIDTTRFEYVTHDKNE